MVTSARPGEGKTFSAINLALSFASERSVKALLVDLDTQHPGLPKIFGFPGDKGIVDVPVGNARLSEVLIETNTQGDGSVWEIALSRDPQQKYMFIADGANHKIHVFDRAALTEIYSFGSGGRQPATGAGARDGVLEGLGRVVIRAGRGEAEVATEIDTGLLPVMLCMSISWQ